jgi:hypothetical protein
VPSTDSDPARRSPPNEVRRTVWLRFESGRSHCFWADGGEGYASKSGAHEAVDRVTLNVPAAPTEEQ